MRYVAVLAFALGCGSSHPPRPGGGSDAPKARVDPRSSRELLIRTAFALIGTGDSEPLIGLADPKDVFHRALECPRDASPESWNPEAENANTRGLTAAAELNKGVFVEVLEIDDREAKVIARAGDSFEGCTVKADLATQTVRVKLHVRENGADVESSVNVEVRSVGGRWYLRSMPSQLDRGSTMRKLASFTDEICACPDMACMKAVNEKLSKWSVEQARSHTKPDTPSPDEMKQMTDVMKRMSDCMTKLMATPTP